MRIGKKKYTVSSLVKRWLAHNFSKENQVCNRQCAFGVRSKYYKDNKCLNRWHPIKCGECWRDSGLKLKRRLREDIYG